MKMKMTTNYKILYLSNNGSARSKITLFSISSHYPISSISPVDSSSSSIFPLSFSFKFSEASRIDLIHLSDTSTISTSLLARVNTNVKQRSWFSILKTLVWA